MNLFYVLKKTEINAKKMIIGGKLDQQARKSRDKLNELFKKKADAINLASETRDVEEEFLWPRTILL